MKTNKIKVVIADDHDLIRQGLKRIIEFEENIKIVGEAQNGEKAINMLEIHEPDVLLLDMKMPLLDGLEALKKIRDKKYLVKIIMLTVEDDRKIIKDAINIGADGYLLKDSAGEEIVDAINAVNKGDKYIDRSLVSLLFSNFIEKDDSKDSELDSLTKREVQVLYYISKGLSNKEIGKQLFISEKTVKNYATNLFRKLNIKDRVHATIIAIENNIEDYYHKKIDSK